YPIIPTLSLHDALPILDMRFVIIGISKLIENKNPILCRFFFRIIPTEFHTFEQGNLGTKGFHRQYSLTSGCGRHHQFELHTVHTCNHSEGDTRIATCRFDQLVAALYLAPYNSRANHVQCGTIFNRSRRIIAFQFDKNLNIRVMVKTTYFDEWCTTDGTDDI